MSYFSVLAMFIGPPLLVLAAWTLRDLRAKRPGLGRREWITLLAHIGLALVYTTPWDNYLVATGVWWYDPDKVLGVTLGYVPLEEYTFFIVQTLLTGLWVLTLRRTVFREPTAVRPVPALRRAAAVAGGVVWLAAAGMLLSGWRPGTYLGLILVWALIPLLIQLMAGADSLWVRRGLVLAGALLPTLYLWIADAVAIGSGTWTIDPAQSTGMMLGVLPLEEMIFFLLTNVLITCGMVLFLSAEMPARARAWGEQAIAAAHARLRPARRLDP